MADVPKGRFVWYELLTTDPEAAQRFYGEVAEWGAEPWKGGSSPYTMLLNGQRPLAGVMPLPEDAMASGARPAWTPYIATPDVDDTLARARELGATLLFGPEDIPDVGRFALIQDPQGAVFGIYTPEDEASVYGGPPVPGDFSWHELAAADHRAAYDFYNDLFGWEKTSDFDMGEMGLYQMYGQDGVVYGGMYDKPADMPAPPHWLLYIKVSDIDAALELVRAQGGQVINGPMEVPGGDRVAQCADPQGAMFALHATGSAA